MDGFAIERVLGDIRGATIELVPRWFKYVFD
jgi:hypothetical protein